MIVPAYHFHEISSVLANPSIDYGGEQWVFSPQYTRYPLKRKWLRESALK